MRKLKKHLKEVLDKDNISTNDELVTISSSIDELETIFKAGALKHPSYGPRAKSMYEVVQKLRNHTRMDRSTSLKNATMNKVDTILQRMANRTEGLLFHKDIDNRIRDIKQTLDKETVFERSNAGYDVDLYGSTWYIRPKNFTGINGTEFLQG